MADRVAARHWKAPWQDLQFQALILTEGVKIMKKSLIVKNIHIQFFAVNKEDFISLTDIARYKNFDDPRFVVQNWMKTRSAVEFLGLWEIINNPNFNRIEFDTFKNESGSNVFVLTSQKWINNTNAIGLFQNQAEMVVG